MKRILPGLAMACLVMGCAEPGAPPPTVSSPEAAPPAESSPENPAIDEAVTYTTVSLKIPGMH